MGEKSPLVAARRYFDDALQLQFSLSTARLIDKFSTNSIIILHFLVKIFCYSFLQFLNVFPK